MLWDRITRIRIFLYLFLKHLHNFNVLLNNGFSRFLSLNVLFTTIILLCQVISKTSYVMKQKTYTCWCWCIYFLTYLEITVLFILQFRKFGTVVQVTSERGRNQVEGGTRVVYTANTLLGKNDKWHSGSLFCLYSTR